MFTKKNVDTVRVYQVAKALDMPSKDVMMYLNYVGIPAKGASSSISSLEAEVVKTRIKQTYLDDFVPYWITPPF